MRPLHVCYVTTGKGYPYAPLDEGMRNTWQELVSQVSVCGPQDGVAAVAGQQQPDLVLPWTEWIFRWSKSKPCGRLGSNRPLDYG